MVASKATRLFTDENVPPKIDIVTLILAPASEKLIPPSKAGNLILVTSPFDVSRKISTSLLVRHGTFQVLLSFQPFQ